MQLPRITNVGLAAIVYSIAMLVAGAIVIFHEGDNTALIVQIFGLATIAGIAILGYKQSIDNGAVQAETKREVRTIAAKVEPLIDTVDVIVAKVAPLETKIDVVHAAVNHQQDLKAAEIAELRETIAVERNESGVPHDSPTPKTDAIKERDADRPPTTP